LPYFVDIGLVGNLEFSPWLLDVEMTIYLPWCFDISGKCEYCLMEG